MCAELLRPPWIIADWQSRHDMREHDEANRILDMDDRREQKRHYRSLPVEIRMSVGGLVRIANLCAREFRMPGWRKEWLDRDTPCA